VVRFCTSSFFDVVDELGENIDCMMAFPHSPLSGSPSFVELSWTVDPFFNLKIIYILLASAV
jgi:hypothetical protein